jgi:hypothetical protein
MLIEKLRLGAGAEGAVSGRRRIKTAGTLGFRDIHNEADFTVRHAGARWSTLEMKE